MEQLVILQWIGIVLLGFVWLGKDETIRELRATVARFRQAEDERRGISELKSSAEICTDCFCDAEPGESRCKQCQYELQNSGDH